MIVFGLGVLAGLVIAWFTTHPAERGALFSRIHALLAKFDKQ